MNDILFAGDATMPLPVAKAKRKVLYKDGPVSPKVSIPKWWVGDTEYVTLRIYNDRIVIIRGVDDDD
ncbi:MAG: hypothetical protein J7K48_03980 [Thermococcus sp.]|nr:hypothetical protein [Thermococcus sp.]